ncbi:MAG: 1-(5-phosphoribosyl)-5-[(5-phosphoribosylamino)methylideneamino]imidazole-4-carboxamide isomerase, partial [Clostridia bacterium]
MRILPAIDIRDKKVVRLIQGDYDQMTIFADNPMDIAKKFALAGAKNMHIVDLDGALHGKLVNFDTIANIVKNSNMEVEVGGGIRDEERIIQYIQAGVARVILGTVAIDDFDFVVRMVAKYGDKIAVGVDSKKGKVATCGWKTISNVDSYEFCLKLANVGVKTVIFTDISKDGLLGGTNLEIYKKLSKIPNLQIIASGGITFIEEIEKLQELNIYGAILGKV